MKRLLLFTFIGILMFGCNSNEKEIPSGKMELTDGWARHGKAGMMSAAYFNLTNNTKKADTLISISSDVTHITQIHKSYQTEDGLMGMQEQAFVALPIGKTTSFEQGGLHVMIIQPERDLSDGDSVTLTLSFSSMDSLVVKLPVKTLSN